MKLNIKIEYKKKEYQHMITMISHVFDRMMDANEIQNTREHEIRMEDRQKRSEKVILPTFDKQNDDIEESEEESSSEESEEESSSDDFCEVEEVDQKQFMVAQGKKVYEELMDGWLVNFMIEDSIQPDRGELLRDLSISKNGFRITAYLQSVNSLTIATLDYLETRDIDHPLDSTVSRPQYARQIAENLSQVSSIVFYQISDFLRYPNPLEI